MYELTRVKYVGSERPIRNGDGSAYFDQCISMIENSGSFLILRYPPRGKRVATHYLEIVKSEGLSGIHPPPWYSPEWKKI